MSVLVECPRCDKSVPVAAAFCRRCGLPLAHAWVVMSPGSGIRRLPRARGQRPPLSRLAALVIVGLCVVLFAALATHPARPRPYPYGGYGGGGGGNSTPVVMPPGPFDFGPGIRSNPDWPPTVYPRPPRYIPSPGRRYGPRTNTYGPGGYGTPYPSQYRNPQPTSPSPGYSPAGPRDPGH